jgi:hypothetical protein
MILIEHHFHLIGVIFLFMEEISVQPRYLAFFLYSQLLFVTNVAILLWSRLRIIKWIGLYNVVESHLELLGG